MRGYQKCCRCSNHAVVQWPNNNEIGIEPDFYCLEHLYEAQLEYLERLST